MLREGLNYLEEAAEEVDYVVFTAGFKRGDYQHEKNKYNGHDEIFCVYLHLLFEGLVIIHHAQLLVQLGNFLSFSQLGAPLVLFVALLNPFIAAHHLYCLNFKLLNVEKHYLNTKTS